MQAKIDDYRSFNFLGTLFSVALLIHAASKIIFNAIAKQKLPLDKWTLLDASSAIFNLVAFNVVGNVTPDQILTTTDKQRLDYYVITIVLLSWFRFFAYFLIIKNISKLLMTLWRMIKETMSFMFIVCCYLMIMSSVFTTLLQEVAPDLFGNIQLATRTLFDAMLGNYSQYEFNRKNWLYIYLMMGHLILSNIFLLNYLIAILSTVYELMMETGDFAYKRHKY